MHRNLPGFGVLTVKGKYHQGQHKRKVFGARYKNQNEAFMSKEGSEFGKTKQKMMGDQKDALDGCRPLLLFLGPKLVSQHLLWAAHNSL